MHLRQIAGKSAWENVNPTLLADSDLGLPSTENSNSSDAKTANNLNEVDSNLSGEKNPNEIESKASSETFSDIPPVVFTESSSGLRICKVVYNDRKFTGLTRDLVALITKHPNFVQDGNFSVKVKDGFDMPDPLFQLHEFLKQKMEVDAARGSSIISELNELGQEPNTLYMVLNPNTESTNEHEEYYRNATKGL